MAFEVCCPLRRNNDSTMFILPEKIVTAALMELVFTDFFSLTPQMQLIVLCIGTVLVILVACFSVRRIVDVVDYIEAGREERNRMRSEKRSFTWRKRDS